VAHSEALAPLHSHTLDLGLSKIAGVRDLVPTMR
jgi:hypothetical protein